MMNGSCKLRWDFTCCHWSCYDSFGLFLITGRGSVWLGRLYRFPQHLTDRQTLRSIKSNHSLMLLLLRQLVLYAITLQRHFHAEMSSRCCSSILKILHVFTFHEFRASRVFFSSCHWVFPFYCNNSCTIVLSRDHGDSVEPCYVTF